MPAMNAPGSLIPQSPETPRTRSGGVTVIAVLSLLGSLLTLLMGVSIAALSLFSSKFGDQDSQLSPGFLRTAMLLASLLYILPAFWGIATSIGLFRLKEWARISIIVFSVFLVVTCGFGAAGLALIPIPPPQNQQVDANIVSGVHVLMTAFTAGIAGIGIWWLVFFTRPGVKQQFVLSQSLGMSREASLPLPATSSVAFATAAPARPLSFTIIAIWLLAGSAFLPANIMLRSPAAIFFQGRNWLAGCALLLCARPCASLHRDCLQ